MIFEAIQHFITPAIREVKALGYVREAIAIEARYKRCRAAWTDHLGKCQQHIMAAAGSLPANSTIMIIGSGAAHDVPMEELLALSHSLILVDIVHLPKIRKRYKNSVQFIEQDVTGWVGPLFHNSSTGDVPGCLPKADMVISLNILSQLPLNLIKYAHRHKISLPDNFAHNIMADHLKLLTDIAPQTLIISDIERHYMKDNVIIEKEAALSQCELGKPSDTWDWHICPKGELDRDISLIHHVAFWHNSPK